MFPTGLAGPRFARATAAFGWTLPSDSIANIFVTMHIGHLLLMPSVSERAIRLSRNQVLSTSFRDVLCPSKDNSHG
jgi:hypothetical protein